MIQPFLSSEAFVEQFEPLLRATLPPEKARHLRAILVDTIAIADHARRHKLGGCAFDDIEPHPSGAAEIWGTTTRTSPTMAAFLNGTAAETLDFQEVLIDGRNNGHSAVVVVPCLLALASTQPMDEERLMRALWIAFCANMLLARALGRGHRTNGPGFRTTSLTAPIAAALAGGYLVGDATTATHATAIAASNLPAGLLASLSPQGGTFSVDKDLSVGFSARHAVMSVLLAKNGATGPASAISGPGSWLNSFGFDTAQADSLTVAPLSVDLNAYVLKYFPTSYGSQCAIRLLLEMREQIALDDIDSVDLFVKTSSKMNAVTEPLTTHVAARFSVFYSAASTLWRGHCTLDDFSPQAIAAPQVAALMDKITLHGVEEYQHLHEKNGVFPCRVVITSKTGERLERACITPQEGYSAEQLSQMLAAKIDDLCLPEIATKLKRIIEPTNEIQSDVGLLDIFFNQGERDEIT